jgi:hypothetical protein
MPTPRRLNFNNVQVSPNRRERSTILATLLEEGLRLETLNLNRYSPRNRSLANGFVRNVINAHQGDREALYRALGNLQRVKRVGGGNISPSRRSPSHRAATAIQSVWRGIKGRRAANWRLRQVNPRYAPVYMMNANGTVKVALPVIPKRK